MNNDKFENKKIEMIPFLFMTISNYNRLFDKWAPIVYITLYRIILINRVVFMRVVVCNYDNDIIVCNAEHKSHENN